MTGLRPWSRLRYVEAPQRCVDQSLGDRQACRDVFGEAGRVAGGDWPGAFNTIGSDQRCHPLPVQRTKAYPAAYLSPHSPDDAKTSRDLRIKSAGRIVPGVTIERFPLHPCHEVRRHTPPPLAALSVRKRGRRTTKSAQSSPARDSGPYSFCKPQLHSYTGRCANSSG